jgi:hypothetical protein
MKTQSEIQKNYKKARESPPTVKFTLKIFEFEQDDDEKDGVARK